MTFDRARYVAGDDKRPPYERPTIRELPRAEGERLWARARRVGVGPGPEPAECPRCQRDSCDGTCPDPDAGPQFLAAAEVMKAAPTEWVIEDLITPGVNVIASESGGGKTFLALSQSGAIISEGDWFGRRTRRGSVAYVTFEADALGLRLQALQSTGVDLTDLYLLRATDPISPRLMKDGTEVPSIGEMFVAGRLQRLVVDLQDRGRPPIAGVYFDTVRASMSGSEDGSENTSAYQRAVRRIIAPVPSAAAVLLHHSGWQDGEARRKRERGSSAWRGNADATLYLEAHEPDESGDVRLTLTTLKLRDAERRPPLHLIRRRVDVQGVDRWGNPLSSCVIVPDTRTRTDREAEAAAEARAEDRALDLRTLRAIADRPEVATSQDRIRQLLGAGKAIVSDSIARLIRAGWILPGRRGEPYSVTEAGRGTLQAEATK